MTTNLTEDLDRVAALTKGIDLQWPYVSEVARKASATLKELEAERDHAWDMVAKANAQIGQSLADRLQDKEEITRLKAQVRFLERKIVS